MAKTIQTKRCSKCKHFKKLSEFHKDLNKRDGYRPNCKICNLKRHGIYHKTEQGKATIKKYRQSPEGKVALATGIKRYYSRHPEVRNAHTAVNNAITVGKLPRVDTLQCHYCPAQAEQYHHYKGYEPEHWLDVVPVCIKCHSQIKESA